MRLVIVARPFAEAGRRRRIELRITRQVAVGQVDVGAVRNGPGQTSDRLSGELGRAVVSGEVHAGGGAQPTLGVNIHVIQANAQADEGANAPGRVTEVINDVGHQGGRLDVAFRRVARAGGRRQVAQALRAGDSAHGADVARAVAALELNAPVGVETVAETGERGPAVVHFPVPFLVARGRLQLDVVVEMIAGVDRAVPAVWFSRRRACCEQSGSGDTGEKFQLHGVLTLQIDPNVPARRQ
ncbi:hypothetical protein D3C72_1271540 [compost metagenome]